MGTKIEWKTGLTIVFMCFLVVLTLPSLALASDIGSPSIEVIEGLYPGKTYSPYAQRSFPSNIYWGETHLHTGLSLDAGLFGATLGHEDAYRFARGEEIKSSLGLPVKLGRPLDWIVITDHSDMMGVAFDIQKGSPNILAIPKGKEWHEGFKKGGEAAGKAAFDLITHFAQMKIPEELLEQYSPGSKVYDSIWEDIIKTADLFNEPGRFTALIGFEWTSVPKGFNLHRNVILRDDGRRASQVIPLTTLPPLGTENFFGKSTSAEPSMTRVTHPFVKSEFGAIEGYELSASGYQAVWAMENTRAAIFDAMERKETYATTGPRIRVRFFGGWDFTDHDMRSRAPAFIGYEKGVPMGGDLSSGMGDKAPTFMVYALRDPVGANLDRIQIIKGWMDKKGKTHEKVYDVAVSDGREIGPDGRCQTPVGNTVDLEAANWTNTIGASELAAVWTDPDFDPNQKALYYARVLEIPTPRWVLYDKVRFGIEIPEEAKLIQQERAYTSPIWYTP